MAEDTARGRRTRFESDSAQLRGHIDQAVRSSVEETLNALSGWRPTSFAARSPWALAWAGGHASRALLRHIAATKWGKRRYLAMETLLTPVQQAAGA